METNLDVNLTILLMGSGVILTFFFFMVWTIFKSWISLILSIVIVGLCSWFSYETFDFDSFSETIDHLKEKVVNLIDKDADTDGDED